MFLHIFAHPLPNPRNPEPNPTLRGTNGPPISFLPLEKSGFSVHSKGGCHAASSPYPVGFLGVTRAGSPVRLGTPRQGPSESPFCRRVPFREQAPPAPAFRRVPDRRAR